MKFKIDKRYIAIQSLFAIGCYILGVLITLTFIKLQDPIGFICSSLLAGVILYIIFLFPRKIVIKDGIISFVEKNRFERSKVRLVDITQIDNDCRFYNTVIILTKSGRKYKLHPRDTKKLLNYIKTGSIN